MIETVIQCTFFIFYKCTHSEIMCEKVFDLKMIWLLFFVIDIILANNGNMILKHLGEKEYSLIKGKKLKG